jgi:MtN3 and saliva related transmembrane protein
MSVDLIGWASSVILLATLLSQIRVQWRARRTEGVSAWLFAGQVAANLGFLGYSVLLENAVFIVTTSVLAMTALLGWILLGIHRRRERRDRAGASAVSEPDRPSRPAPLAEHLGRG